MSDQGRHDKRRDDEAELTLPRIEPVNVVRGDFGLRLDDQFDLDSYGGLDPSDLDDDAVDFSRVHADDAFLDALGAAVRGESAVRPDSQDAELAALLSSWRDDVDAAPIGELVDTKYAVATVFAAKARKARKPRLLVPLAAAAAAIAIAFTGAGLAARDAQPGDTLWGLTKVLYADHARSIEAAAAVRQDLQIAQTALAEGKLAEAKDKLEDAQAGLPSVSSEDGQADLAQQHAELVSQLPGTPANEVVPPPSGSPTTVPPPSTTVQPSSPPSTTTPQPPSSTPTTTPAPTTTEEPTTTPPETQPATEAPRVEPETGSTGQGAQGEIAPNPSPTS
ncbi:anti-sigma-D factor RsdA [Actinokineospora sp. HUAS TT18]|uniref:anti-sigma-D factor RsdA n=1 Tax=Actinokineospora sp. HUAS TT18 TaxID=3447451 RepID=UPI003F5226F2